jgi:lipocalin
MKPELLQALIGKARDLGFDTDELIMVEHAPGAPED